MAAGDILSGAFTLIRRNARTVLGLAAAVVTVNQIVTTLIAVAINHRLPSRLLILPGRQATIGQVNGELSDFAHSLPYILGLEIADLLILIVFRSILTGTLTQALGRGVLGHAVSIGQTLRNTRLGAVLAVAFLTLAIYLGLWAVPTAAVIALLAAGLPAAAAIIGVLGVIAALVLTVWLYVMLSLAMPSVILERLGPRAALARSWRLVRGSFWRLLGILLLASLIVSVTAGLLTAPVTAARLALSGSLTSMSLVLSPGWLIATAVAGIISGTLTAPIAAGVNVLLYTDLRMRKEGMDLVLQDAARNQQLTGDEFATLWRPAADPRPQPQPPPGTRSQ
jgi:hypothetical protein